MTLWAIEHLFLVSQTLKFLYLSILLLRKQALKKETNSSLNMAKGKKDSMGENSRKKID